MKISRKQIFLATAAMIPSRTRDGSETLVENPYKKWSDIDQVPAGQQDRSPGPAADLRHP